MVDTAAAFRTAGPDDPSSSTVSSGLQMVWYPSAWDCHQIDCSSGPLARRNEVRYTVLGLEQCGPTFGTGVPMPRCTLKNVGFVARAARPGAT
jgi:hypothetical protein